MTSPRLQVANVTNRYPSVVANDVVSPTINLARATIEQIGEWMRGVWPVTDARESGSPNVRPREKAGTDHGVKHAQA